MKNYVGVDIGGTTVKTAIVSEKGKILRSSAIPTKPNRPYRELIADVAEQIKELCAGEKFEAIGIGCPGIIDSVKGFIVYSCNLFWRDVPLGDEMAKIFGVPVKVSNDANCAALGENMFGAGKEYPDTAFITLGTGVGGGIVADGKLIEGYGGMGAEIGHMVIVSGGLPCACGRKGCFEAYGSATALIRDTIFAMQTDKKSLMWEYAGDDLNKVDGRTSFECAKKGDKTAQKVVDRYIECLADGITNVVNIFRSQAVIIGGGVSAQGEFLTKPLQKLVDERRYGGAGSLPTKIITAALGNDAGVIGAASLVM